MGAQRGGFETSGSIPQDRVLSSFLQTGESVTSAGAGALLIPSMRPERGKVYVTTLRLAVVLDDSRLTPMWSKLWHEIDHIRVKKGFMGATAFVSTNDSEMGVDSTKAIIGDVERAWHHMRSNQPRLEASSPNFLPTVDIRCGKCGAEIRAGSARCPMCLRLINWPPVLEDLSRAITNPELLLPSQFPDGSSTQREVMFAGLSTLVAAAYCLHLTEFIDQTAMLLSAIKHRRATPASSFGHLPPMRGTGDPSSNEKFWQIACGIPSRLATEDQSS